jgi:hypothetical protein
MKSGGIALILSALALGAAIYGVSRESPTQSQRSPVRNDRVATLEAQVAELTRKVDSLRAAQPEKEPPGAETPPGEAFDAPVDVPYADTQLEAIVDEAVDRKAKQVMDEMRIKQNKKPEIGVFASMLKLTEEQRAATERIVVDGQRKVHAILDLPTYDGTNLMDELVEIVARGAAEPGKDHGFGRWIGRVLSEKIPGTDETYGARIEAVKSTMRASFKREWSAAQYREFESWGVDPTEVQNVPGSPNERIRDRIVERARALGAEIPEED